MNAYSELYELQKTRSNWAPLKVPWIGRDRTNRHSTRKRSVTPNSNAKLLILDLCHAFERLLSSDTTQVELEALRQQITDALSSVSSPEEYVRLLNQITKDLGHQTASRELEVVDDWINQVQENARLQADRRKETEIINEQINELKSQANEIRLKIKAKIRQYHSNPQVQSVLL